MHLLSGGNADRGIKVAYRSGLTILCTYVKFVFKFYIPYVHYSVYYIHRICVVFVYPFFYCTLLCH